ncbi:MAG: hypothetical protein AAFX86_13815 [Pseudomonadota bacterium]
MVIHAVPRHQKSPGEGWSLHHDFVISAVVADDETKRPRQPRDELGRFDPLRGSPGDGESRWIVDPRNPYRMALVLAAYGGSAYDNADKEDELPVPEARDVPLVLTIEGVPDSLVAEDVIEIKHVLGGSGGMSTNVFQGDEITVNPGAQFELDAPGYLIAPFEQDGVVSDGGEGSAIVRVSSTDALLDSGVSNVAITLMPMPIEGAPTTVSFRLRYTTSYADNGTVGFEDKTLSACRVFAEGTQSGRGSLFQVNDYGDFDANGGFDHLNTNEDVSIVFDGVGDDVELCRAFEPVDLGPARELQDLEDLYEVAIAPRSDRLVAAIFVNSARNRDEFARWDEIVEAFLGIYKAGRQRADGSAPLWTDGAIYGVDNSALVPVHSQPETFPPTLGNDPDLRGGIVDDILAAPLLGVSEFENALIAASNRMASDNWHFLYYDDRSGRSDCAGFQFERRIRDLPGSKPASIVVVQSALTEFDGQRELERAREVVTLCPDNGQFQVYAFNEEEQVRGRRFGEGLRAIARDYCEQIGGADCDILFD